MKTRAEFVVSVHTVDSRWLLSVNTGNGRCRTYQYSKHIINFIFGGVDGMIHACSVSAIEYPS